MSTEENLLYVQGKRVLRKLAGLSRPVSSWPHCPRELRNIEIVHGSTDHLDGRPSITHVLTDLLRAGQDGEHISITNFTLNGPADHVSIETVLKSLIMSGVGNEQSVEVMTPIGALTIPSSMKGLGDIDFLPKQFNLSSELFFEQFHFDGAGYPSTLAPSWESCLIPSGAVTGPHTDYCGCAQLIQHVQGRKLWLCWPPSPHNLEVYLKEHLSGNLQFSTEDAIDRLEGMELIKLDAQQTCFVLPAGTIHAVLTMSNSCHTGLKLWRRQDFEVARSMSDIQGNLMKKKEELDKASYDLLRNYFHDLTGELKNWEELRKKVGEGRTMSDFGGGLWTLQK